MSNSYTTTPRLRSGRPARSGAGTLGHWLALLATALLPTLAVQAQTAPCAPAYTTGGTRTRASYYTTHQQSFTAPCSGRLTTMVFTWPSGADDFRGNGVYVVRASLKDAAGTTTLATSASTDQIAAGLTTTFDLSSANAQLSTGTQYRWELQEVEVATGQVNFPVYLLDLYGGNPYTGGQAFASTGSGGQTAPTAAEDYRGWTVNIAANAATTATVTTTAPAAITTTGATLGGNVTADGGATITERGVVYVAGAGTPTTANTKLTSAGTTGSFTVSATGLAAGTQYTVRAYATNSAGTSYGSSQSFTTTTAAPTLASLSPTSGPAGTSVTLTGTNFTGATAVSFNGTAAASFTVNSGTSITATVPTGASTGNVTVTTPGGPSNGVPFSVTVPLAASISSRTNVTCFGGATGTATVTVSGGTAPYTYSWNTTPAQATATATGLAAGTYTVTVTDATSQTTTAQATISQPATALSATTGKTDATTNGGNDGTATVTPAGGTPPYSYLWSNSATTPSIFGLTAGTYSVTVTDANGCQATGSATVGQPAPAVTDLTISTGTAASPVGIAAGTYNNITVTGTGFGQLSGAVTVNGTFLVQGSLSTNCQALTGPGSFTLASGATLEICDLAGIATTGSTGAVQLTGTRSFSQEANYVYNNPTTTSQAAGTGLPAQVRELAYANNGTLVLAQSVAVRQRLQLLGATSLNTGPSVITLLSDAAGTALVVSGRGVVTGNLVAQRYIDPSTNAGVGYRHLAMLPGAATVASYFGSGGTTPVFNTAYNTSATPLNTTPFPTVFGYDQARLATSPAAGLAAFDKGWFSPAGTEVVSGRPARPTAYTVQLPGASTLSVGASDRTSFTYSLARNTDATAPDAGWNFVANPFLAPLDWSTVPAGQRTNLDAAMYVFESTSQYGGQYRSYANGIGASPLIGLAQGFWVRVSSGAASGSLALTNANRVTDYAQQAPVRRGAADPRPLLQLQLAGPTGPADDLFVYAEAGATPALDAEFDAAKLPNSSGLNLASLSTAGEQLAIDGRPAFATATTVPLFVGVPATGRYTFTAASLANLAGTRAELVDNLTGTRTLLAPGTSYGFTMTGFTAPGRFWLNLTPAAAPLASSPAALAAQVSVYPNPSAGLVTVLRPATGPASAEVLNALGQVVRRVALPTAETALDLRQLPSGVYLLRLSVAGQPVTKRLVIE